MTEKIPPTTVEIFRDVDAHRDIPLESVYAAIEYVGEIAGKLTVINDSHRIRLGKPTYPMCVMERVRWPKFEAQMNLVLTERTIVSSATSQNAEKEAAITQLPRILGIANFSSFWRPTSKDVAIVDVASTPNVKEVMTHEIGHLFGLSRKNRAVSADGGTHCPDPTCVMKPDTGLRIAHEKVHKRGVSGILERIGIAAPEYVPRYVDEITPFCADCTEELGRTAMMRSLARQGRTVPQFLL